MNAMSLAGYISEKMLDKLVNEILDNYADVVSLVEVPNDILDAAENTQEYQRVLRFRIKGNDNDGKCSSQPNSSVLLTGAHHSRELTSIQMICYTMLRLLFEYEQSLQSAGDSYFGRLLRCHDIYFIPVVNLDGFHEIQELWNQRHQLEYVRKNMHPAKSKVCRDKVEGVGVDLNRNYDFAFGYDNNGSNGGPCEEDYRGPMPFSEPATRQIKNFLEETEEGKSVKIALNFHAWGNLLVYPFNYVDRALDSETILSYDLS